MSRAAQQQHRNSATCCITYLHTASLRPWQVCLGVLQRWWCTVVIEMRREREKEGAPERERERHILAVHLSSAERRTHSHEHTLISSAEQNTLRQTHSTLYSP